MKTKNDLTPYQLSALQQNELWLNGVSVHNPLTDECCPDFSCCFNPSNGIITSYEKRLKRVNYLRDCYGMEPIT